MPYIDEKSINLFAQFGIAGLILFVLAIVVMTGIYMVKTIVREGSKDRMIAEDRWRATFSEIAHQFDARQSETNTILRDLAGTIRVVEGLVKK